jgi:hypothetical protein
MKTTIEKQQRSSPSLEASPLAPLCRELENSDESADAERSKWKPFSSRDIRNAYQAVVVCCLVGNFNPSLKYSNLPVDPKLFIHVVVDTEDELIAVLKPNCVPYYSSIS